MTDPGAARLRLLVRRLSRGLRLRRALAHATRGLFSGLLAALLIAAAAASVRIPRPVLLACVAAAAGTAAGAGSGLLRRIDTRRLLIDADRRLASRELIGTGYEIAVTGSRGIFSDAVVQDAADLLSRPGAARALGPFRPGLALLLPAIAALVVAAFLFPVDFRALLARGPNRDALLATIGEDLRGLGERLEEASRAQDLGRRLALSQELAQLGRDLADHRITTDDALDRITDLQDRVGREYQLQMQAGPRATQSLPRGSELGGQGSESKGSANARESPPAGAGRSSTGDSTDLAGAMDRLRDARDLLQGSEKSAARSPSAGQSPGGSGPTGTDQAGKGTGAGKNGVDGTGLAGGGGSGEGAGTEAEGGKSPTGSAPGTAPAPVKTGPPTSITAGGQGSPRRAQGNAGEGDSTSFLVRALPEWTGARLPEDAVRRQYARAAESALLRDEVPPKLKAYVRDYFTNIGMPAGGADQAAGAGQPGGGQ